MPDCKKRQSLTVVCFDSVCICCGIFVFITLMLTSMVSRLQQQNLLF